MHESDEGTQRTAERKETSERVDGKREGERAKFNGTKETRWILRKEVIVVLGKR